MCKKYLLCLFFISLVFSEKAFAEDTLYVQSMKAKVYSEPSFSSQVFLELTKGYKVVAYEKEGNWVKVLIGGKNGYISSFLLGKTPPFDKVEFSKEGSLAQPENPRSRVSQPTTAVAGVRGLSQERRARLGKEEKVNYEALEKIEAIAVSDEELKIFMKEGNL